MGWGITALIPDPRQPGTRNPSRTLALRYGAGALVSALLCLCIGHSSGRQWPAASCPWLMPPAFPRLLGKENGTLSPRAEWCLLPVLLATRWYQHRWLKRVPGWHEADGGVMFGRRVTAAEARQLTAEGDLAVLDLTAESNAPAAFREHASYHNLPLLDLVPLQPEHIQQALAIIRQERTSGRRVYMHCQLGLQRSALIAAHWLLAEGKAGTLAEATQRISKLEPLAVLD